MSILPGNATGQSPSRVAAPAHDRRPLIAHLMYRFDTGGLENGVVNLINHMPEGAYRHAIISLTEVTDFRQRIERDDVEFVALNKPPGQGFWLYPQMYALFRRLRPAILHSRNLAALEAAIPAWAARVPVRIHGEHGRDVGDLDGSNRKYQRLRRLYVPFVSRYIALSQDLEHYLTERVGIAADRVVQFYNGVDAQRFRPATPRLPIAGCPFADPELCLIGTVGRMQTVKDQPTLARAFIHCLQTEPALRRRLRLVMVGDGPLRAEAMALLDAAGVADLAWLPGERRHVPEVLRGLDLFILPSLAEGISNTILEAMACGLPVVATAVGGNGELVEAGVSGELCPAGNPPAMAELILGYAADPEKRRDAGRAGRARVEQRFSLEAMVSSYQRLYDEMLAPRRHPLA